MLFSRYVAVPLVAAASLIAPVRVQQAVAPSGTITGIVRSAADARPIARARVTLTSAALTAPRVAIAASDGTYIFDKLPAGAYTVRASASGFAPQAYRQRPNGDGVPVGLANAQRITDIDFALRIAGVLAGRILDEDRRPFAGASVDALVSRLENSQAVLVSVGNTVTDDRGEFRLAGLPEGDYYVSAFDPAFAEAGDETGPLRYSATYYPGVVQADDARRVRVTPGSSAAPIEFALRIVRPARVSGIITAPGRKQLLSGAVMMTPVNADGLTAVPSDDVRIDPDGRFTFRNVPPGQYQIRARAEVDKEQAALFGSYRVVVGGRDLHDIELPLLPGAIVDGTIVYNGRQTRPPRTFKGVRVRAPFADGSSFGDALTGTVEPDGSYRIRGLMTGIHAITVEGLEHPWVVESVTWRGNDITDAGLEADTRQRIEDVRITLTDVANEVAGIVRDAGGQPVENALVVVMPLTARDWHRASRRLIAQRTDRNGQYRIRGLPAGDYRAFASSDLDQSEIYRRELLEEIAAAGQPLKLGAPQSHALDLPLTSLAAARRASGF